MKYKYDLHIHSCLSPCADDEMTPNNIVGMSVLSGYDVIAITDHNTCKNAQAVMEAGAEVGIIVVPGMELCTAEEAHVICLFESLESAMEFDSYVFENMPNIKNRPEVFGEQRIMNASDEQIGVIEQMLLVASFIGVDDVADIVGSYGGVAYPAHVNRDSYSVIASLGTIPSDSGFVAAEITRDCDVKELMGKHTELESMLILQNSDAHYLEKLVEQASEIDIDERSVSAVIKAIKIGRI